MKIMLIVSKVVDVGGGGTVLALVFIVVVVGGSCGWLWWLW